MPTIAARLTRIEHQMAASHSSTPTLTHLLWEIERRREMTPDELAESRREWRRRWGAPGSDAPPGTYAAVLQKCARGLSEGASTPSAKGAK